MSAGPENTFIGSVHKHLPVDLYHMKNHNQYNGGIADVWYSGPRADLWVEYKFVQVPMRNDTLVDLVNGKRPDLSHLQQEWIKSRAAEGRQVWVIVGSKSGGVVFRDLSWASPMTAEKFREALLTRAAIAEIISKAVT